MCYSLHCHICDPALEKRPHMGDRVISFYIILPRRLPISGKTQWFSDQKCRSYEVLKILSQCQPMLQMRQILPNFSSWAYRLVFPGVKHTGEVKKLCYLLTYLILCFGKKISKWGGIFRYNTVFIARISLGVILAIIHSLYKFHLH